MIPAAAAAIAATACGSGVSIRHPQPSSARKPADEHPAHRPDPPQRKIAEVRMPRRVPYDAPPDSGPSAQVIVDHLGQPGDAGARRVVCGFAPPGAPTTAQRTARFLGAQIRVCSDSEDNSNSSARSGAVASCHQRGVRLPGQRGRQRSRTEPPPAAACAPPSPARPQPAHPRRPEGRFRSRGARSRWRSTRSPPLR